MSSQKKIAFAVVAAIVCCANFAAAQTRSGDSHSGLKYHTIGLGHHYPSHNNFGRNFGRRSYGYYRHYGYELSDVIRSRAQANLVNAQARTQNEVARSAALDNDVKELATYHERRRINSTSRFAQLWEQGAQVRAIKAAAAESAQLAGIPSNINERLTPEELNAETGRLRWPLLLQMERFTRARGPVNDLFKHRAATGTINPDHYLPLTDWIEKVALELNKNVHNYPAIDFAEAQDFLDRLVSEARLPAPLPMATRLVAK